MVIGRDLELAEIRTALGSSRLVTLVGPGGVGKTTLATAIANEAPTDSVLFSALAPLVEVDLSEGIAGSLGFSSFDDMLGNVKRRGGLVVLDNCEHVLEDAARTADEILAASPLVRVLATSRERLDLEYEQVVSVHPLSTEGTPSPAARLLLNILAKRGIVVDDDPAVVDELCRRLDGLPLALELAAARMSALTAAEIITNLEPGLDLLSRTRPRGPERHQSLAATIAWSFDQLDDDAKSVLIAMSIPPGPCDMDMVIALAGRSANETWPIVSDLVERSLLVHEPLADRSWYRMLETIRSFVGGQSTAHVNQVASDRLIDHMADWADGMDVESATSDLLTPVRLEQAFRTLSWAIERTIERNDMTCCHRLVMPLWWMAEIGHQSESIDLIRRVIERWSDDNSEGTETCWGTLASVLLAAGARDDAYATATRAAEGSGIGAAYGERVLGQLYRGTGEWQAALDHLERSSSLARNCGQEALALEAGIHRALTIARSGDLDAAIVEHRELLVASKRYPLVHAWVSDFMAYVLLGVDPAESAAVSASTLADAERAGNGWLIASSNSSLAFAMLLDGRVDAAARYTINATEAYRSIRNRTDISLAFWAGAAVLAQWGHLEHARSAMAADHEYTNATVGGFETDLLQRIGPIPEVEDNTVPLEPSQLVRLLTAGLSASRPAVTGDPAESGASAGSTSQPNKLDPEKEPKSGHRFVLIGDSWEIEHDGLVILQRASKGLSDIATLLAAPNREIAALDMMGASVVSGDAGPLSDSDARLHYQERIRELQADIDEAENNADYARTQQASAEMDQLIEQLSSAYGLSGRNRTQGDPAERARSAVTARVRSAIKRIGESHPSLGEHLSMHITTGRFCSYSPPYDMEWITERP